MHSILVVDDDRLIREMLADALTRSGHLVLQCVDGKDVIKVLKQHPTDLLITDVLMEQVDGLVTITNARKQFPLLKIIAISGGGALTEQDYLPIARKLGAHAVFHKPLDLDRVLNTVAQLLTKSPPNPAS